MRDDKPLGRAKEIAAALREEARRHPDIWLYRDAADVIEGFFAGNAELQKRYDEINNFEKTQCAELLGKLSRVAAERDAAIADISHVCATCGRFDDGMCPVLRYKDYPKDCEHWLWRGAQEEA